MPQFIHHAAGPARRRRDVRPRRRRRALSGIRAAVPSAERARARKREGEHGRYRRRHDGRLQVRSARPSPAASRSTAPIWRSWSNTWTARSAAEQSLDVPPAGDRRLRRRVLHRLRVPQPHARRADGQRCSTPPSAASPPPSNAAPTSSTAADRRKPLKFDCLWLIRNLQPDASSASACNSASASATERSRTRRRPILP